MHNTKLQKNHHLFLVFIHFVNLLYNKCWDHNVEYLNYKGLDFCSFFPILFFGLNHRLNIVLPCSQPTPGITSSACPSHCCLRCANSVLCSSSMTELNAKHYKHGFMCALPRNAGALRGQSCCLVIPTSLTSPAQRLGETVLKRWELNWKATAPSDLPWVSSQRDLISPNSNYGNRCPHTQITKDFTQSKCK